MLYIYDICEEFFLNIQENVKYIRNIRKYTFRRKGR